MKKISIDNLSFDLTKPLTINFSDITINKLTLMTGLNGTGKSFMMVSFYAFSEVANMIAIGFHPDRLKESAQFIMDNSFTSKDITGTIIGNFDDGSGITMKLSEGTVESVIYSGFEDVEVTRVRYMSAKMRTFEAMKSYLTIRKMSRLTEQTEESRSAMMLTAYRLYDMAYMEMLIGRMPFDDRAKFDEYLKNFSDIKSRPVRIDIDLDVCDFYMTDDAGVKTYMSTLSSGHQSIYNMLIGSSI